MTHAISPSDRGERRRIRPAGRWLLALSGVALGLVLLSTGGAVYGWARNPRPPPPCPLPALAIPRPGDLLAWTPDSRRLLVGNRLGEMWVVRFPEWTVTALPAFRQEPWEIAWDAAGRPLAVFGAGYPHTGLARLDLERGRWERLPIGGAQLTVSPDGRRIAMVQAEQWKLSASHTPSLVVADIASGRVERRASVPASSFFQILWDGPATVIVTGDLKRWTGSLEYRVDTGRLRRIPRRGYPPRPVLSRYQDSRLPGEELRQKLRAWNLLPPDDRPSLDWSLVVTDRSGHELRRVPLGRRPEGRRVTRGPAWYHTWKRGSLSPDGRYLVVGAADDTLRVLDLQAPP